MSSKNYLDVLGSHYIMINKFMLDNLFKKFIFVGYQSSLKRQIAVKVLPKIHHHAPDGQNFPARGGINPENILIEGYKNRPLIVDFGLAQVSRKPDETSTMIVGTPKYMAPKQILNSEVDGRADIYATATMLYEILTPEPLFSDINSIQDLFNKTLISMGRLFAKRPSEMNPVLNQEMDRILTCALSVNLETRYATCGDFRAQLYVDEELLGQRLSVSRIVAHFKKTGIESVSFYRGVEKKSAPFP